MKTIADEWEHFKHMVVPMGAPDIQKSEMQLAFYGGVYVMLNLLTGVVAAENNEVKAVQMLEEYRKECEIFTLKRLTESDTNGRANA
jgi:hypothetical protein